MYQDILDKNSDAIYHEDEKGGFNWFERKKIKLLEWPRQTYDLNPIENLWKELKNWGHWRDPPNFQDLETVKVEEWAKIRPEQCLHLVSPIKGVLNRLPIKAFVRSIKQLSVSMFISHYSTSFNLWTSMVWFLWMCGLDGLLPTSDFIAPLEIYLLRTCSILILPGVGWDSSPGNLEYVSYQCYSYLLAWDIWQFMLFGICPKVITSFFRITINACCVDRHLLPCRCWDISG